MVVQFLLLFCLLIIIHNTVRIEGLTNSKRSLPSSYLLIGDSMLKNDIYVNKGESVSDQLRKYTKVDIIAEDNAKIQDIAHQLQSYTPTSPASDLVISIGGNNILEEIPFYNGPDVDNLFDEYKNTIIHIKKTLKIPPNHIILCNIYYPPSYIFRKYDKTISKWNKLLNRFASTNGFKILNVATTMNAEEDFTHEIEPSHIGGGKMVAALNGLV